VGCGSQLVVPPANGGPFNQAGPALRQQYPIASCVPATRVIPGTARECRDRGGELAHISVAGSSRPRAEGGGRLRLEPLLGQGRPAQAGRWLAQLQTRAPSAAEHECPNKS